MRPQQRGKPVHIRVRAAKPCVKRINRRFLPGRKGWHGHRKKVHARGAPGGVAARTVPTAAQEGSASFQGWPSVQRAGVAVGRTEIPTLGFPLLRPLPGRIKPRAFHRHRRRPFHRPLLPHLPLNALGRRPPLKLPRRVLKHAPAGLFERGGGMDDCKRRKSDDGHRQNPNSVHHRTLSIGVRTDPRKPSSRRSARARRC